MKKISRNGFIMLEKKYSHLWRSKKSNKFAQGFKPHSNILKGFTLVELLVVIVVIAIVAAAGGIAINQQLPEYRLRGDVRTLTSSLMLARMKATSAGLQHAIQFNLNANPQQYVLQKGDLSGGSTNWTNLNYTRKLSSGVNIFQVGDDDGTHSNGTARIIYNPNGSSGKGDIRLRLGKLEDGYQILLTLTTGRVQTIKGWPG